MTEQSLTELVDLYLVRCDVEGRSPRTVRAYRWTLARFLRELADDAAPTRPADITREHLYGYLACFTHLATDTRHRYFREVRCFFNWLVEAGYLDRSPFHGMKNVRLPQRIVRPYSTSVVRPEEVHALLNDIEQAPPGARSTHRQWSPASQDLQFSCRRSRCVPIGGSGEEMVATAVGSSVAINEGASKG